MIKKVINKKVLIFLCEILINNFNNYEIKIMK